MIGQTVSHYKIFEELGGGGMGVVYKAEDTRLKRTVALKFLPPEVTRDSDAKTRFIHEAQAASALQHHNICTIHEIDETDDGRLFIAMDCYEGETLKDRITRGALSVDEVIDIANQIAQGLAKAHGAGMVHRDIKPANIMITSDGIVKILDFGLAKLAGQTKVTKTGTTVGTVAYMSPEQATGKLVDQRSDIFSLGAVLYEMLAGEVPFKGDHEAAVLYGVMHNDPEPVLKHRADVPEEMIRIIDTALRKDPQGRYHNASELAADLHRFRTGLSTLHAANRAGVVRRWSPTIAAVSIVLVIATYFVYQRFFPPTSEHGLAGRKMIAVLPFENLGAAEDEYFADGVTEEITARLAGVQELGVIARTSAVQYKNTNKSIQEIGEELGVDYIIEGTIRWQRSSGKSNRIRVTPLLIRVSDATHVWADIYDEPVADVFDVQAGIALRVVEALDIALLERERRSLSSVPTDNFEAYTEYLRGRAFETRSYSQKDQNAAEQAYKKAIELDPDFALAYAGLSLVHSEIYFQRYDRTPARAAMAKSAAEDALRLAPELPGANKAMGKYFYACQQNYDRALEFYETAAKLEGSDGDIFASIGFIERRKGHWTKALENIKRASEIDPRSALAAAEVGGTYCLLRDYTEAERYFQRALSLDSEVAEFYAWMVPVYLLWDGNTERARTILQNAMVETVDHSGLREYVLYLDILDERYDDALRLVSSEPSETLGDGIGYANSYVPRFQDLADIYTLMGEHEIARIYQDSARVVIESKVQKSPDDPNFHAALGIAYARLQAKEDAVREGKLACELLPVSKDAIAGYYRAVDLAKIYTRTGESDAAIDLLDYLLSIPGTLSTKLLKLDPTWALLREHPRFHELLDKYAAAYQ